jgi:hypothetical protein
VVSRDVKFEENLASRKSQDLPVVAEGPQEVDPKDEPRAETSSAGSQTLEEVKEQSAPSTSVRRLRWFEQTLRDAREHVKPPRTTLQESKPPRKFPTYMALMTNIIDSEPSNFEEAASQQMWRDAMMEEHNSIMRNDVWEIVSRPKGSGDFQVALQGKTCSRWHCEEVQGHICGSWNLSKRGSRLRGDFCSCSQILLYPSSTIHCF